MDATDRDPCRRRGHRRLPRPERRGSCTTGPTRRDRDRCGGDRVRADRRAARGRRARGVRRPGAGRARRRPGRCPARSTNGSADARGVASSLDDVLTADDVAVAVVATVHDALAPIAAALVERGAHVLVEKPAGRSLVRCRRPRRRRRASRRRRPGRLQPPLPPGVPAGQGSRRQRAVRTDHAHPGPLRPRRSHRVRDRVAGRAQSIRRGRTDRPGEPPDRPDEVLVR